MFCVVLAKAHAQAMVQVQHDVSARVQLLFNEGSYKLCCLLCSPFRKFLLLRLLLFPLGQDRHLLAQVSDLHHEVQNELPGLGLL